MLTYLTYLIMAELKRSQRVEWQIFGFLSDLDLDLDKIHNIEQTRPKFLSLQKNGFCFGL